MSDDVVGRLAKRPYEAGDPMPAVGSKCLVSGANCDVESDQHRAYGWRTVVGYGVNDEFICMQTRDCWPTVERLSNCWFAEIPSPRAPAPQASKQNLSYLLTELDEYVSRHYKEQPHCVCNLSSVVARLRTQIATLERSLTGETTSSRLTNEQCQEVISFLEDFEWTGLSLDNVRTWDEAIHSARQVKAPAASETSAVTRDTPKVREIFERHDRCSKLLWGPAALPGMMLGPEDADAAHRDRGTLLSLIPGPPRHPKTECRTPPPGYTIAKEP